MIDLDEWEEIDIGMSNFDEDIPDEMPQLLTNKKVHGYHAAWDHYGYVYYKDGFFHEDVYVGGNFVQTITSETLEDLMSEVNAIFGWD